jgi:hypothetical protein
MPPEAEPQKANALTESQRLSARTAAKPRQREDHKKPGLLNREGIANQIEDFKCKDTEYECRKRDEKVEE